MTLNIIRDKLGELGLERAVIALESRAEQAVKNEWSYVEFLDQLLTEEVTARRQRSLAARTRLAKIPSIKTLAEFDYDAQLGVDR